MLPIKSGRLKKPVKAVFYGLEGTGKSTLAQKLAASLPCEKHPRGTDAQSFVL